MRLRWRLAGFAATICVLGAAAPEPTWQEIAWPFPRDAWPGGRAFRCVSDSCGGDVAVYIRAKRGLCANCATGVTEDAEVDGVSDIDMMSQDFVPLAPGEAVAFGGMSGRSRAYTVQLETGSQAPAVGYAVSRKPQCDLVVVASEGPAAATPEGRAAVRALLAGPSLAQWIDGQLEGR